MRSLSNVARCAIVTGAVLMASASSASAQQAASADSMAARRDSLMNVVLAAIRGRENLPAESVFKNLTILRGMPAARIPRIMNLGFGRSLGVGCAHCHNTDDFSDDRKKEKLIAREMWKMVTRLNGEILPAIPNLKSAQPTVNCTTCHRGNTKPALNL